ncbi:hypothetical protein LCGC14_1708320 [marine sediment metagenome]|uniref:SprT-like domain-containing protein n=1 Tax=marine sediment metagenome TaxID=412755 RepID=A0A0F9KG09_9ZZZZ
MPKPLTLLNRFDRLNRRHFKGRLKRPSMVRFSKQPDPDDPLAVGHTIMQDDGRVYIFIHEVLEPFTPLTDLVLVHELVHLQNLLRGVSRRDDDCLKLKSVHHRKMLSILAKEPVLC